MAGQKRERPEGSGRWELVVYRGRHPQTGKKTYTSRIFRNTDEVMATGSVRKRSAEADLALARMVVDTADKPMASNGDATFAEVLETWYRLVRDSLSPRSKVNVRQRIDNHIVPALGWKPVGRISVADLDAFYAHLRGSADPVDGIAGKGLAHDTVKKVHGVCSNALTLAVSYGWIDRNPASLTQKIKGDRVRPSVPPLEDVRFLIDNASAWDRAFGNFLFAKVSLGCRRQEMVGLRLHDIDFEAGVVTVRRKVVDEPGGVLRIIDDTKGRNIRRFPIAAPELAVLQSQRIYMELRAARHKTTLRPDAFLFSHEPDGSRPWSPQYVSRAFRNLRGRIGVSFRLHDLRHVAGTHLVAAGVSIPNVASRLGHKRNSTTLDVYAHPLASEDLAAANALSERLALGKPGLSLESLRKTVIQPRESVI